MSEPLYPPELCKDIVDECLNVISSGEKPPLFKEPID